jgi:dCTP deaminase
MILTGSEIINQQKLGMIFIDPFFDEQVNPNSYNYRLGKSLKVFVGNSSDEYEFEEIEIPEDGYQLSPGKMYLGATHEVIGSDKFSMSLIGRSSMGRLGVFLQISANLGHVTSKHNWTLEIYCTKPVIVYPKMIIGQVSFWANEGEAMGYEGRYGRINEPQENLDLSLKQNHHII